jgi:hypothetical protein
LSETIVKMSDFNAFEPVFMVAVIIGWPICYGIVCGLEKLLAGFDG